MARALAFILLITLIACTYAASVPTDPETIAKYESETEVSPLESAEVVRGYKKKRWGKKCCGKKKRWGKKRYGGKKKYRKRR